jgi:uncharacterized protein (TIGR02145 family)
MRQKNVILFAVTLFCIGLTGLHAQTVKDIDGNIYKTVTIGTQVWMTENLKTTKNNDGTAILLVTDDKACETLGTPAFCWYNIDEPANKNRYGALYNWYAVSTNKLCPKGWHVSTDAEWTTLTTYSKTRDHTIGESYGGGIVFYLTADGTHGLVAATQDQSSTTTWYEAQNNISNPANHNIEGKKYIDWRLPTKYELNLLYLQKTVVGNFANIGYWSSSENYYNSAWGQNFSNGFQFNGSKLATLSMRAVRVF